jgi:hypothetical protein
MRITRLESPTAVLKNPPPDLSSNSSSCFSVGRMAA